MKNIFSFSNPGTTGPVAGDDPNAKPVATLGDVPPATPPATPPAAPPAHDPLTTRSQPEPGPSAQKITIPGTDKVLILSPLMPPLPHKWLDPSLKEIERALVDVKLPPDMAALSPATRPGYRQYADSNSTLSPRLNNHELASKMAHSETDNDYRWQYDFRCCRLCECRCSIVYRYSDCCHDIVMLADNETPFSLESMPLAVTRAPGKQKSRYPHVYYVRKTNRYMAQIYICGVKVYLGTYETDFDAACVVDNFLFWGWARQLWKDRKGGLLPKPDLQFPGQYDTAIHGKNIAAAIDYVHEKLEKIERNGGVKALQGRHI